MKDKSKKVFVELLKDSKRSDRQLAKSVGVSQPTITRIRRKLVQKGLIREFTIIPDFEKIGFEIMAITLVKSKAKRELIEEGKKEAMKIPNIILAARAQGLGKNAVIISLHKTYTDYSNFISNMSLDYSDSIESYDSILVSLSQLVVKPFSLKYIAQLVEASDITI